MSTAALPSPCRSDDLSTKGYLFPPCAVKHVALHMKVFKPDRPWKLYLVVAVPLVLTVVLAVVLLSGGKNGPDAPVDTAPGSSETLIFNPSATLPPVTLDVAAGSNVSFTSSDVSEPTGSGSQPPETTTEPPVFNAPPLVYASTETLSGTESDNGATVLSYEIRYPVFAAADGSSASPDKLNAGLAGLAAEYKTYALEELLTYAKQAHAAGDNTLPYTVTVDFEVEVCSINAVSVVFTKTEHAGETRDSFTRRAYNYSPVNSSAFSLSNIFSVSSSTYLSNIYDAVLAEIEKNPSLYYGDYPNLVKFFELSARWYFSEDGLVVFFNPFEIAPYSAGIVEFTLPYGDLSGIMKINPLYMG